MKQKELRKLAAAVLCGALALTGCGQEKKTTEYGREETPKTQEAEAAAEKVLTDGSDEKPEDAAVKEFALRLFENSLENGKNVLVSPLSVFSVLSMTANGAKGETKTQMEQTLGLSPERLNDYFSSRVQSLPSAEKYQFHMANSVWLKEAQNFQVNEDFLKSSKDSYGADVFWEAFDDETAGKINRWVLENTDGMIDKILEEIPKQARMYLINAVSFDAEWEQAYTEAQVTDGSFTREDGSTRDVKLMNSEEYQYLKDEHASGFVKYYADRSYAFAALLPEEGLSVKDYAASLTGEKLERILADASEETVRAVLPKFEVEYGTELNNALKNMGIQDAFDPERADFTGIAISEEESLYIGHVLHKTHIAVDERGTKAGAVTSVEMRATGMVEEPKMVILDRPFLYFLIDCESRTPLFVGALME